MTNPDYPTNVGDFMSHTYQQPQQQQYNSFYYGGMGCMQMQQFQPDSRRNDPSMMNQQYPSQMNQCYNQFNPQNPMASFNALYQNNGYGAPYAPMPQLPASELNIRPFSSYPPEYTSPQNQFNVTDSRRLDGVPQNNPWATPAPNPFAPQGQSMPQYINPNMDCGAMYGQMTVPQMNRKTPQWDNPYTQPQPTQMPTIDWNAQNNPYGQMMNAQSPMYPQVNMVQPQQNESWTMIAQQNWK